MDPIGPGNHERAWNDPPKFAFNSSVPAGPGNPSGRRRLLNKRVPVPTGPQGGSISIPPPLKPGDGPPMGSPPLGPPVFGSPGTGPPTDNQLSEKTFASPTQPTISQSGDVRSSLEILKDVETAFENSFGKVSNHLKDNVRDGISKRFELMKSMWLEGKLTDVVQKRMLTLTKALEGGDYDKAWSIHQGLIVDFTSMCSPWMIGMKTLITECRNYAKTDSNDVDPDEQNSDVDQTKVVMLSPEDINRVVISDPKDDNHPEVEEQEEK